MNAKTVTAEIRERLAQRLQRMEEATTPTELAYTIWTKQLEEAMGSSRKPYRDPFIDWIEAYSKDSVPKQWTSYKTLADLAEGIWNPKLDTNESDVLWFGSLKSGLVKWIENYKFPR